MSSILYTLSGGGHSGLALYPRVPAEPAVRFKRGPLGQGSEVKCLLMKLQITHSPIGSNTKECPLNCLPSLHYSKTEAGKAILV